jgi:alkanesulfonate monooxygenase
MRLTYAGTAVDVFALVPRSFAVEPWWQELIAVADLSDRFGYSGILIYNGNDVFVEPLLLAFALVQRTTHLMPLVAVNPVYMHPFSVARAVASIAQLHRRRLFMNLITGTALSHLAALDDQLGHDDRYERLVEFGSLVMELLTGRPVTRSGRFYRTQNLQLPLRVRTELMPGLLVAGQSAAALAAARTLGATSLQMLPPGLETSPDRGRGVNLGVVTRVSEIEAWRVAKERYRDDDVGRKVLEASFSNTDSEWKRRLEVVATQAAAASPGFWLDPFRNFQADQPFFVGSHRQVAQLISTLVRSGIRVFVLDVPATEVEFSNLAAAFELAQDDLASSPS